MFALPLLRLATQDSLFATRLPPFLASTDREQ
jgi:hypothetical protein